METKKLYRSETNKVFAGICGGLAEYFDIDAVVIRLFWLLLVIFSGFFPGVIAYFLAIMLVPRKPHAHSHEHKEHTHSHEHKEHSHEHSH